VPLNAGVVSLTCPFNTGRVFNAVACTDSEFRIAVTRSELAAAQADVAEIREQSSDLEVSLARDYEMTLHTAQYAAWNLVTVTSGGQPQRPSP
jgi:hypothetical protein